MIGRSTILNYSVSYKAHESAKKKSIPEKISGVGLQNKYFFQSSNSRNKSKWLRILKLMLF